MLLTDSLKREWNVKINISSARRIDAADYSELKIEPFSCLNPKRELWKNILFNNGLAAFMTYAAVYPQVLEQIVDFDEDTSKTKEEKRQEQFMNGFDGAAIEKAKEVLFAEFGDFFPELKTFLLTSLKQYRQSREEISNAMCSAEEEILKISSEEILLKGQKLIDAFRKDFTARLNKIPDA